VTDVTDQITAHLMDAVKLAIAASDGEPGKYALIVQASVDTQGGIILEWERYGPK
jgi:hypothetical protein